MVLSDLSSVDLIDENDLIVIIYNKPDIPSFLIHALLLGDDNVTSIVCRQFTSLYANIHPNLLFELQNIWINDYVHFVIYVVTRELFQNKKYEKGTLILTFKSSILPELQTIREKENILNVKELMSVMRMLINLTDNYSYIMELMKEDHSLIPLLEVIAIITWK
jgi:hypothetical protein